MRKATKKPIEIEFLTFEDLKKIFEDEHEIQKFLNNIHEDCDVEAFGNKEFFIKTLEHYGASRIRMTQDDILIIGVNKEVYPCKKEIFNKTYDFDK